MRHRGLEVLLGALVGAILGCTCGPGNEPAGGSAAGAPTAAGRGLVRNLPGSADGYVLFTPILSYTTFLIDKEGRVVHTWESDRPPGISPYLLDNGHLLRCAQQESRVAAFGNAGTGGRIQEFDWEGNLLWDWSVAYESMLQHHDIEPLPNGNVLLVAYERKTAEDAIRAGRDPSLVPSRGVWPDCVLEVRPERPRGGTVVWEWHVWDHLIQGRDPARENFGDPSAHPERVDVNGAPHPERGSEEAIEKLRTLGYLGGGGGGGGNDRIELSDFMHTNSVAYNPRLDQIALSVLYFDEVWIIDHGTTTREAAGPAGGRAGRGGDLLYRWGNPRAYRRGAFGDRRLFAQHDARWIPEGHPGAGNLTVFNNGTGRPGTDYSSVVEVEPPLEPDGTYRIGPGRRFGPARPVWEYTAPKKGAFLAEFISGAHRLRNGDTLVCSGPDGRLFEVTPRGEIVWEYRNPFTGDAPNPSGDPAYAVFRATLIPPDHPGLAGRTLEPLDPQPPLYGTRSGAAARHTASTSPRKARW